MSLKKAIESALRARFPDAAFRWDSGPDLVAIIQSPNETIGEVRITAETDEATITIGNLTHGHFNRFDLEEVDSANAATAQLVADFLADLFADRVVIWRQRFSGGWDILAEGESVKSHGTAESHLWSRPLPRR